MLTPTSFTRVEGAVSFRILIGGLEKQSRYGTKPQLTATFQSLTHNDSVNPPAMALILMWYSTTGQFRFSSIHYELKCPAIFQIQDL